MEHFLGQPSNYVHCTRFTTLTDEISVVAHNVKVLVISCLSGIVHSLSSSQDSKSAIIKGMDMLAAVCHSLIVQRGGAVRIFFAPCTPKRVPDFQTHSTFALVIITWLISYSLQRNEAVNLSFLRNVCLMQSAICHRHLYSVGVVTMISRLMGPI
jgi:hypothetical protein